MELEVYLFRAPHQPVPVLLTEMQVIALEHLVYGVIFLPFLPSVIYVCNTWQVKSGLAQMLKVCQLSTTQSFIDLINDMAFLSQKGGVIMDVINAEQVRVM